MNFVSFQRAMTLLMAAGLMVFVIALALPRHQYPLIAIVVAVFLLYIAFNIWLFQRMRGSGKS